MAFWKKSDDPWDRKIEPEQPRNSFQEYVDQWNATLEKEKGEREAKRKAQEEYENAAFAVSSSMDCPWCGQEMDKVYIYGRRGVVWQQTPPAGVDWIAAWPLGRDSDTLWGYRAAWYCPDCQRMALDVKFPYGYKRKEKQED